MGCKIVIIGGGSYTCTPTFACDLFLRKGLNGSHLSLADINAEAADVMKRYCELLQSRINSGWTVTVDSLDTALAGADVVCVSISTGGLAAMDKDYKIPEKYGIYHTVGDTAGPGGISRTLRNIPVFLDIAHRMEKLCPNAWMIHVTNPLSQLTRAVSMETSVKCVGLCHNYAGTITMLADYFGVEESDVNAVSVGVNHFTWLKELACKGKSAEDRLSPDGYVRYFNNKNGILVTNTTDDIIQKELVGHNMEYYFNFYLFERFDYFPVGASNQVTENLPFYCNDLKVMKKYHIRRKGVLPRRQMLIDHKVGNIHEILEMKQPLPELKLSNEGLSVITEALYTKKPARCIVTMVNSGQVSNLPMDAAVETWADINGDGVFPEASGSIPGNLTGTMQTIVDEQETTVKAALTGDWKMVVLALAISPEVRIPALVLMKNILIIFTVKII